MLRFFERGEQFLCVRRRKLSRSVGETVNESDDASVFRIKIHVF